MDFRLGHEQSICMGAVWAKDATPCEGLVRGVGCLMASVISCSQDAQSGRKLCLVASGLA